MTPKDLPDHWNQVHLGLQRVDGLRVMVDLFAEEDHPEDHLVKLLSTPCFKAHLPSWTSASYVLSAETLLEASVEADERWPLPLWLRGPGPVQKSYKPYQGPKLTGPGMFGVVEEPVGESQEVEDASLEEIAELLGWRVEE